MPDEIPVRTEMTVLDADEPQKKLNWSVKEYIGVEVYSAPPGLSYDQVRDTSNWPEGFKPEPIKEQDAIWEGAHILIPGMFGGIGVYRVAKMDDGSFCGRSGGMIAFLEFGQDDRNCWTCGGMGNLDAIQKLSLEG